MSTEDEWRHNLWKQEDALAETSLHVSEAFTGVGDIARHYVQESPQQPDQAGSLAAIGIAIVYPLIALWRLRAWLVDSDQTSEASEEADEER